jgi:hypothetical protein
MDWDNSDPNKLEAQVLQKELFKWLFILTCFRLLVLGNKDLFSGDIIIYVGEVISTRIM